MVEPACRLPCLPDEDPCLGCAAAYMAPEDEEELRADRARAEADRAVDELEQDLRDLARVA